eukprot:7184627-Prymnesium_polylepis.1
MASADEFNPSGRQQTSSTHTGIGQPRQMTSSTQAHCVELNVWRIHAHGGAMWATDFTCGWYS